MKDEKMFIKLSIVISIAILIIAIFTSELDSLFENLSIIFNFFGVFIIIGLFGKDEITKDGLIALLGIIIGLAGLSSSYTLLGILAFFDGICIFAIAYKKEDKNTVHKSSSRISNASKEDREMFLEINKDKFSRKEEKGGRIDEENNEISDNNTSDN